MNRIAILPFQNTAEESWDYLTEGLTELAAQYFMKKNGFLVINQESIEQILSREKNAQKDLIHLLDLDFLIKGELKIDEVLQLELQLVNKEKVFWKESLSADLKQVVLFGNQLIQLLEDKFGSDSERSESKERVLPKNKQAYRAYLYGNHYLNKWDRAYAELALVQYEKVIDIEPDFIPAYLGYAKVIVFLVSRGWRKASKEYPSVMVMLNRMLLLNPNYGELYIYKGVIDLFYHLDWEAAYLNIEKGLKNYCEASEAYEQLSFFWYGMREYDKAIDAIHAAMEYNPLSISLLNMKGDLLLSAKRYDASTKIFESILELQPNDKVSLENLMYIGALEDNERKCRKYLRLLTEDGKADIVAYPRLCYVYAFLGMEKETKIVIQELERLIKEDENGSHYNRLANVCSALGEWEKAMTCIEKTFPLRTGLLFVLTDPQFEPLRKWKRYQTLEQQIKLPQNLLSEETINIQSELKARIELNPDLLLFAKSDENYITLVSYKNFRLEKTLLRLSLKGLLAQLPEGQFFHCHRSYIVNKKLEFKASGNARGYLLHSLEYGFEIPVSRSKIKDMDSNLELS